MLKTSLSSICAYNVCHPGLLLTASAESQRCNFFAAAINCDIDRLLCLRGILIGKGCRDDSRSKRKEEKKTKCTTERGQLCDISAIAADKTYAYP